MRPPRFEDNDDDFRYRSEQRRDYTTPILVGIIFILLVGIGGFFLYSNRNNSSQQPVSEADQPVYVLQDSSDLQESEDSASGKTIEKEEQNESSETKSSEDTSAESNEKDSQDKIEINIQNNLPDTSSSTQVPAQSQQPVTSYTPQQTPTIERRPMEVADPDMLNHEYILPYSSTQLLHNPEGMTAQQLCYARNEIYARHGRMFNSSELQNYFNSKSWYTPIYSPEAFDESVLNEVEVANIQTLKEKEWELYPGGYPVR